MWGNNFCKAGAHQQSALCCDGQPATMSGSRTSLPSPSYAAQPARPPPAGVLSADLARPISVRELAQSRVPAVPPPPPATQAPRPSATTAGFAGFGVPTSSAVYAATSGVSTSRPLSTHADAGDLTSLAHRGIDHLSGSELYNYASHLQESSRQYSGYLSAAYAKRDQYRGEVAHLKEELHNRYVEIDALRREQERASDALLKVREDNAQLRQKLAEAEGHARNMQAKMSVLSGADPSIAVHFYQSQLALKDAQLRELQQECERAAAASSQRRSSSTTAAEHGRRSANISGEGAAAPHTSPSRDLPSAEELQDGAEAASAALHTALEELQCLNTSLSHRLEEEHTAHKAALAAHAEASATATADRAELLDTIAQLRQQCADMQSAEDELVAALTQRAPISKKDYASLQASYDDLTAALAKAEAQVAALQEKEQQHHHSAQQAQEELRHSLTTGLEERQSMQARNEQMQSLVNNLERELELAERANQLRQEQLDVAISGNQQLAESLHVAQEQLLSATSELQDLRDTRESLESQLRELRQRIEELEQGEQHQRHRHGGAEAERTLIHTPAASAESEASQQRQESEAELASLRSQRDAVVGDRDDIIGEVRRLPDERRALLISPPAHAEEQLQSRSSAVRAPLDVRADDREWQKQEDIAALEAAHQCIEQMKQTIAALQSERVRVEADLKAEVNTLEAELASQSRALAEAEAAAAAQQAHLEEVMAALRDELVATQAQEKRLRASEEAHRERCAEHQRAVEQLQAHVEELERAARDAASSLPTPPPAQPSTAAESELRAMNAALDSLAYQLEDAQHRVKELSAEHARTVEELARATRAVAELEARAADAEGKHEVMHTAAEVTEAELMARVAALTAENAQLREKLSTSRAAVTTFASRQTDGESAAASLEERCAAEARRSEAAEAEASALRETLNGTAAELAEVLQRSEDVQATLERTVARLAEQESLVGVLSAESTRLQDELATAQRSVLLLTSERDALGEEAAGLRGKISAAEDRASDAAAAQQRLQACLEEAEAAVRSKDVELSTALAALDRTASEVCDAEQRLQVYSEAKEQLAAEHARTVEELARATRAVAELEARAADAEGKHEVMHTAAEVTEAELMARVAALTAENAQLREKLSTSRAAVTTFASRQTDGESAAASLEERCAAEARRSEAAEAEASALRETLNGTAAELAEVLQRSEDVQATLERTVARLAEQESLVGVLSAESTRLQDELATAQRSVLLLTSERDALGEEAAGLRGKISAAEDRASDAAAAQQRLQACLEEAEAAVRSKDVELSTALAALDRTASEVCDAEQRLQVYSEAKEQLAAEHARTVEELARATRAVAELEARAADAEGKHEVMHTAAEVTEAELMARVAALTAENAQLREKLSTSRAAVTTFASRQTDGESAAASLEERCAAEARRSEAAEAEASALRETLNGTAAELAEVLQRSEDVQATLERTVARLAEQEALVEQLNYDASELNDARAVLTDEVTRLQKALAAAVSDKADVVAQLLATQKELDRAAEAQDAQYRDEERLQDALATTTSAFDVQTTQVRLGMAHVVDMSRAFCRVAEVAVQRSASQTDGASGTGTSVQEILSPWTRALEWVAAMEQRLEALDRGAMPNSFTRTNGRRERRRRRRGRTTESENDDAVEMESNSGSYVLGTSPLCRAVPANRAEAAFARLIDEQAAATNTIADLRRTLADKEVDLTNLRSAMDALASDLMGERDRADNLSAAIDDASEKIASAQAEFEEQLRQRTAVTTAEVVEARRAEARATAAQLRAEEQLAAVEKDLKEQEAVLRKLQDENHRLTREADRLLRTSRLEPSSRARSNVSGSVTPKSLSLSATSAENAAQRFTTAPSTLEAIEQAQILQVSSLQADLMLSRRQARELEGREATLRQACAALEQQVSELRAKAAEAEHLREDLATLRADYVELEQRYSELELMATAAGGGTMQELKQLRQQLKVREAELEEVKARMRDLVLSKAAPELQAARRQEALRESLSGITTQLAATQAQYGGGTGGSSKARSRRDSLTAALSNSDLNLSSSRPSPQDVLNSRIEHLQTLVHDREVALEKVQAAQLESRAAMDTLEDQLAAKTAALERAEGLVAEYADTINAFTMAAVARRGNRGAVSTTVPPLSSGMGSPDAEALSASVPTLTPLTPRTRAAVNGQPHAAVAMVSPAPRMPNLDEVADDSDGSGEGKQADSAGPSTDSAPPPVTHRRTSASGSWRGAKSCPAHRPSSSTERSAPSSPSNVPGRKSFAGASVPATTRKRARSSTNS
ncbi:hypothetical protein, unknown function [Leishmania infantum JPCM5]|uniref:NUP-1 protein n=1 Tax=Leishmania infantum TaxID=5671 RepID=A4I2Y8_LEIIN|nr:hypothetical protein, unknown function [Leishmania infantum JPCM5]CAM69140.1 hypothetical protein, unknown function [Leishmania infantum JPCM5]|eukprot:XP_001466421.1 hypothetical protein, unknown function [Leishmania infantum JPCM5]